MCELVSSKLPVPVQRIGMRDTFGESGNARALLEKYELDAKGIGRQILENKYSS